ncbi:MAG: phosphatidate cytidylyltransferase [Methylobacteriaceae bacterium]|nr:phosphatidate cytidylyltransferase [Methylobacteriaceae bacterium]
MTGLAAHHKMLMLFAGVGALLVVASAIGWALARRVATPEGRATIDNLNARIRAWWVMIAIFAVGFLLGPAATLILFALTSFYTLREFVSLTPTRAADVPPIAASFYLFLPLQYWLIWTEWYGLFAILIPVYAFLLLPSLAALTGDVQDFLLRVARLQWGLMLTVYCVSHAPALLTLDIPGYLDQRFFLLFFLIAVVQMSDVLQYVFGKLFGRRKVAPVVSPSKTWEGLIGGGLSATALGAALWWMTPFTPLQAAGMAFVIVAMGFLGGLSLSAIKRSMGAKDWGTMVKGHGGVLDRMDSVCFAAPVFFHLTRFFFTP